MITTHPSHYKAWSEAQDFKSTRIFSFGGGVQSVAVMVLQAQGKLLEPYDYFVFSNVGDDSEFPGTIEYYNDYVTPFAAKHGLNFVEVHKTTRGEKETLLEYLYRMEKSVSIPVRMSNGAPGRRSCTSDFKIHVVDKWIKQNDYQAAIVALGLSIDEFTRVRHENWHDKHSGKKIGYLKKREHPLINLGLSRFDCANIILSAGLPLPPKSACWFCPFTSRHEWIERKKSNVKVLIDGQEMQIFKAAVKLEKHLNEKRNAIGRDIVYIHPMTKGQMRTLDEAVPDQMSFWDIEPEEMACVDSSCMT